MTQALHSAGGEKGIELFGGRVSSGCKMMAAIAVMEMELLGAVALPLLISAFVVAAMTSSGLSLNISTFFLN